MILFHLTYHLNYYSKVTHSYHPDAVTVPKSVCTQGDILGLQM